MKVVVNRSARTQLRSKLADNLEDSADLLVGGVKDLISIQGPPSSSPGEPPHIDTGELIDSYHPETDRRNLVAYVGSDCPHSIYTNLGTVNMDARPHLLPALLNNAAALTSELCKS